MENNPLLSINNRLLDAGYNSLDPEGYVAQLLRNNADNSAALMINNLLDHASSNQSDIDANDIHGALLCLTDGTLKLQSSSEAHRLIRILTHSCLHPSKPAVTPAAQTSSVLP